MTSRPAVPSSVSERDVPVIVQPARPASAQRRQPLLSAARLQAWRRRQPSRPWRSQREEFAHRIIPQWGASDRARRRCSAHRPGPSGDAQRLRRRPDPELAEAFVDVGKARAVLLAGDGPSFCAGADVEWMRASVELDFDANVADANALRAMLEAIDRCPAPVVARVQGHALGGGAGLVACADIAVAEQQGGLRLLRGEARDHPGRDLAVRDRQDRAELGSALLRHRRAVRRGDGAADRARARSRRRPGRGSRAGAGGAAQCRPRAARHAKRLVLDRPDGPETARRIAERRTSAEGQEGLRAFLERRSPDWG